MKRRALPSSILFAALGLLVLSGCKPNPHDNARIPDPYPDKPVKNHKFDGGEADPYGQGEGGSSGEGAEKAAPAGE